jgi:hypothetical protein
LEGFSTRCGPFPRQICLEKGALFPVKDPATSRLDIVNGTDEGGGGEVLEKEGAESLIPREIATKVAYPPARWDKTMEEVRGAPTNLTAASAEVTPIAFRKPLLR